MYHPQQHRDALVSVILPNYNHSLYLKERITSILQQSYQNLEIILLDDKSTDSSLQILRTYQDHPKVKTLLENNTNSGSPFSQWAKGIDYAKGEYLWIAETDDYCEPNFLQSLVQLLEGHPSAAFAYCNSIAVDNVGTQLKQLRSPLSVDDAWTIHGGKAVIRNFLSRENIIPNASATLIRRQLLPKEALNIAKTFRLNGDWYFWYSLLKEHDVIHLSEPLNYFRFHLTTARTKALNDGTNFIEWVRLLQIMSSESFLSACDAKTITKEISQSFYENLRTKDTYLRSHAQFRRQCRLLGVDDVTFYSQCTILARLLKHAARSTKTNVARKMRSYLNRQ